MLPALNIGGIERGVVDLSRELVRHGWDSIVLSAGGELRGGLMMTAVATSFLIVPPKIHLTPHSSMAFAPPVAAIRTGHHSHRSRVPAWLLRFVGAPCSTVSTFHGLYKVGRYSSRMAAADKVICPSTAVFEHVSRHYGTPDERLAVIHRA